MGSFVQIVTVQIDLISKSACIDGPEASAATADDIATDSEDRITGVGYQSDEGTLASVSRLQRRYGYRFAKRAFDIAFSLLVLALFWWVYVVVAIAIKVDDPAGPVFFVQERMGKNEKPFKMYKFRSMYADAERRAAAVLQRASREHEHCGSASRAEERD
jgi:hypothetical protein